MEAEDYHALPTSPPHTQPRVVHRHEQEYSSTLPIRLEEEQESQTRPIPDPHHGNRRTKR